MSIRIGANPIGWTNDDLQDIGGDMPLETCLAQAKEAGVVGMEKGHKLPSDGAALKDKLAEFGLSFVGGWYSTELLKRSAREEFKAAKSHIAMTKGDWDRHRYRGRDVERHPRRPLEAVVRAPAAA
jgi:sugar phosphate isomerase/epimerase